MPWAFAPLLAALAVSSAAAPPSMPLERAVGQKVVTAFAGTAPSRNLLRRLRSGHLGGVVLFAGNITSPRQLRGLTKRLRAAAAAGGNPPPLIAVDQEGGLVKRLPWAPPRSAPAAMRAPGAEGRATGRALRAAGITVDLAPVADVERHPNFLGSRAFGSTEPEVAREACAFAAGLRAEHVTPTLKHFPGLGDAGANTDLARVTIRAALRLAPYRRCASGGLVLLYGGGEATSAGAYRRLLRAVRERRLGEQRVRDSAARIIALKRARRART